MAQRLFTHQSYQAERNVVRLYAQLTFGSSGAVTLVTANSKGFCKATKNSTGKYTLQFGTVSPGGGVNAIDTYYKVLQMTPTWDATGNSGTAPAAPAVYLTDNSVGTAGSGSFQITCLAANGGSATNPASGENLFLEVEVGNSNTY